MQCIKDLCGGKVKCNNVGFQTNVPNDICPSNSVYDSCNDVENERCHDIQSFEM